ncbi:rab11 family-interacting protein 3-like [Fundulus heteroclitus]|uniref:rab11 family-interacting protein 3-like n=1 Tax=Fundulus heteroclitus TaxID=8078 RepID=UPI00165AA11B|nr:rab11 family-interacting protein 3-like [Fundulus heteroclitus]XP_021173546.2 rab11 family-interacting protein 3-like [Fundulus heteroclitus]
MEELPRISDEEEPVTVGIKDLSERFDLALKKYRQAKELHEKLIEQGQITEELMAEMEQENRTLVNRIQDLKEQTEKEKKSIEKNSEILQQKGLVLNKMKIGQMEDKLKELKEENEQLAAELDDLVKDCQGETAAEIEIKDNQKIQMALQNKDAQIERLSRIESEWKGEIERNATIIEDLRKELKHLDKHQRDIEEEHNLMVLKYEADTEAQHSLEEDNDEHNNRKCWWPCGAMILQRGARAAGYMVLVVILFAFIMGFLATTCGIPDPTCNLWMMAFELLEPYGELAYSNPPVF